MSETLHCFAHGADSKAGTGGQEIQDELVDAQPSVAVQVGDDDSDMHRSGMQTDPAVKSVLLLMSIERFNLGV